MSAQFLKNQAQFINYAQSLLESAFEENDFEAAQVMAKLLSDLTASYSHMNSGSTSSKPAFIGGKAASGAALGAMNQMRQRQQPKPQPSSYKWPDNFQGVSIQQEQEQLNDLPMQDAWDE